HHSPRYAQPGDNSPRGRDLKPDHLGMASLPRCTGPPAWLDWPSSEEAGARGGPSDQRPHQRPRGERTRPGRVAAAGLVHASLAAPAPGPAPGPAAAFAADAVADGRPDVL